MKRIIAMLICSVFFLNGCTLILQKGRRSDIEKIKALRSRIEELNDAREKLKESLAEEIEDKQVRLEMAKKGLVITFVAEVLFDSGKAKLKQECYPVLDKVIEVLEDEAFDNDIGIEGHTDNVPIKYSRWKTNWELSAQRALSVLYYLESKGISPTRLKAIGYGEHHPIADNSTAAGRQVNRRVEIVILPKVTREEETEEGEYYDEEVLEYEEGYQYYEDETGYYQEEYGLDEEGGSDDTTEIIEEELK